MVFSLIWAVLCAIASGLFSEVIAKLQKENWDQSKDERIQWRYQQALAAVVRKSPIFRPNVVSVLACLVPRRSLLPRCPREVWERAGVYLSVTSQLTVESRIDRAENA